MLVDGTINGQPRKLVLQASRNGYFFVLDRTNGKSILTKPFATVNWSKGIDQLGRPIPDPAKEPNQDGVLIAPDEGGATNFWPPTFDPKTGLLIVNAKDGYGIYFFKPEHGAYGWAVAPITRSPEKGASARDRLQDGKDRVGTPLPERQFFRGGPQYGYEPDDHRRQRRERAGASIERRECSVARKYRQDGRCSGDVSAGWEAIFVAHGWERIVRIRAAVASLVNSSGTPRTHSNALQCNIRVASMRLILGILLAASAVIGQTAPKDRMVIVISLDGFPAYSLEDPKLPIPTLRRLIRDGGSARMTIVNPTVTWPNHTSMVTGVRADEHGLIANGTIINAPAAPKVEPMIDKEKMVHSPTVYDAAHRAGLTTAQVDWVAISNAPAMTSNFNEWATPEGPLEQEMIHQGVVSRADLENFSKFNILHRDQIWTTAAVYLIRQHKPNLLLVHFLTLDSVHHQYGPNSLAATSAMAFLDSCVARIVEAAKATGMLDRTTFLIVSDHGFKKYTKQVRPAVALASAGLAGQVHLLPEGGTAYVYFDQARAAGIAPKVRQALDHVEGISADPRPRRVPCARAPRSIGPADVSAPAHRPGWLLVHGRHRRTRYGGGPAAGWQPRLPGERPRNGCHLHRQRIRRQAEFELGEGR